VDSDGVIAGLLIDPQADVPIAASPSNPAETIDRAFVFMGLAVVVVLSSSTSYDDGRALAGARNAPVDDAATTPYQRGNNAPFRWSPAS